MSERIFESTSFSTENPLDALKIHPDLIDAVTGNPEALRQLANMQFKAIININHPDKGGDGSLIEPATEAMNEIRGSDTKQMESLVDEYYQIHDQSEEGEGRISSSTRKEYIHEITRRKAETQALLECYKTPTPDFDKAFVQLGKSAINEDDDTLLVSGLVPSNEKFVIVDSQFKGQLVAPKSPNINLDFSFNLDPDSTMIINDETVEMSANVASSKQKRNFDSSSSIDNQSSDITTELFTVYMKAEKPYHVQSALNILGVVDREIIEEEYYPSNDDEAFQIESKDTNDLVVVWQDVGSFMYLKDLQPVHSPEEMVDKYIVLAHAKESQIALWGLCRQIG
ncbi:hypothetical protein EBZ57_02320 [bacterium]|nr:hypothetical protein [bacterium]